MTDAIVRVVENRAVVTASGTDLLAPLVAQAAGYRDEAEIAAATALAASGPNYASTSAGLAATAEGGAFAVDNGDGTVTVYREVSGSAVAQRTLATTAFIASTYASKSGVETITNKTFGGAAPFVMDGGQAVFTSADALPPSQPGLVHVQNEDATNVGLLVNSFWEGATGTAYENNDTTLFVTYNSTVSDSANRSWSASCSNNYNKIPEGVRDGGTRVGVIGWAGSVAVGDYIHAGTLAEQYGVRGTAGFQGSGTPATAVVENAIGVEGVIIGQSTGATIENAVAGRFISDEELSTVVDNCGVYARATGGSNSNYSFYGAGGDLFNVGPIVSENYVEGTNFQIDGVLFADKDEADTYLRVWTPAANIATYYGAAETVHANTTHAFGPIGAASIWATITVDGVRSNGKFLLGAATLADADGSTWHRLWRSNGNIGLYMGGAQTLHTNAEHVFGSNGLGATFATVNSTGLDVVGLLRGDSLRINQTPTAETVVCTHTITVSLNGTNYKIPCVAA